jgi:hypothetical protein
MAKFKKKNVHTCVFIFSTIFVWNISHSRKKWARHKEKCILVFVKSAPLFLSDFSPQIFKRMLKYQISRKSAPWEPSSFMQMARHDKANSHFSQFLQMCLKTIFIQKKMACTNTKAQIIQLLCSSLCSNEKSVNLKAATDNFFHRKYNSK